MQLQLAILLLTVCINPWQVYGLLETPDAPYNCSSETITSEQKLEKLRELNSVLYFGPNSVIEVRQVDHFFEAYCYRFHDLPLQKRTKLQEEPVDVQIGIIVEEISRIQTSDYVGIFHMTLSWNDQNLVHPFKPIYINDDKIIEKMWLPAFVVANAADTKPGSFLRKNHYVEIQPTGKTMYRTRLEINAVCKMKFALYPFDTQYCGLDIESYAYPPEQMRLFWETRDLDKHAEQIEHMQHSKYAIYVAKEIDFIQFSLRKVAAKNAEFVKQMGYNVTKLQFRMIWRRRLLYHFIYTFIPTLFMVLVSYLTLFLDASALMPRIAMNITTMLTLQTLSSSLGRSLPPVSYLKAIDTWIIGCNVLIVGALVEFIAANFLHRDVFNISWKQIRKSRIGDLEPAEGERSPAEIAGQRALAHIVDKASRVIFLVIYVVCIILFWSVYPAQYFSDGKLSDGSWSE